MSFGGAKQTATTNQQTSPWQPAQQGLEGILSGAQNWMDTAGSRQFYPGQTFAAMSDPTKAGQSLLANGQPNTGAAQGYYGDALSGKFASAENPYFKQMTDSITAGVLPGVNATFSKAGMTGSDPHQYNVTSALANAISPYAYQNYQSGLDRMQSAAAAAPQLDQGIAQQKIAAGQLGEGYQQKQIDQNMAKYNYDQNRQLTAMQQAAGLINPIAGMGGQSSGTTTQQTQTSPLQSMLGLGMMGASMFGSGGMFPGVGSAVGGGMAGMFGGGGAAPSAGAASWLPSFNNASLYPGLGYR